MYATDVIWLFTVIYALIPMLTKPEIRSQRLVSLYFWTWIVGSVAMAVATAGASSGVT